MLSNDFFPYEIISWNAQKNVIFQVFNVQWKLKDMFDKELRAEFLTVIYTEVLTSL